LKIRVDIVVKRELTCGVVANFRDDKDRDNDKYNDGHCQQTKYS